MLEQLSNSEMQSSRTCRSLPCTKRDKSLLARHLQTVTLVFLHNSTVIFILSVQERREREQKEVCSHGVSECVECIQLVRHGNECVISENNAMF